MKKFIITLGVRVFLLYCLYLLLFKGLNFVFPAWGDVIFGLQDLIRNNLLHTTSWFLEHIGNINVNQNVDSLIYNDKCSMKIIDNCLGIKLMYIYALLIIAYPGSKLKNKLWYIPMGFAILHLVNISRMIVLSYTILYSNYFEFVHGFVFRVLFYGTTFLLWYIWIKKYVAPQKFDDDVIKQNQTNSEKPIE